MLGAHISVRQITSLAHGELENLLGAGRIGEVWTSRRSGFSFLYSLLDFLLDLVEVDTKVLEDGGSYSLTFTDEAKQDVLGTDVFVMETRSLLTSHGENLSYSLCEVVPVHRCNPQCGSR